MEFFSKEKVMRNLCISILTFVLLGCQSFKEPVSDLTLEERIISSYIETFDVKNFEEELIKKLSLILKVDEEYGRERIEFYMNETANMRMKWTEGDEFCYFSTSVADDHSHSISGFALIRNSIVVEYLKTSEAIE